MNKVGKVSSVLYHFVHQVVIVITVGADGQKNVDVDSVGLVTIVQSVFHILAVYMEVALNRGLVIVYLDGVALNVMNS